MPSREIALEYFRMAVYIFWKKQPDKHIMRLEGTETHRDGKFDVITVNRVFNEYHVEGFII
jgi:hypothetical protein